MGANQKGKGHSSEHRKQAAWVFLVTTLLIIIIALAVLYFLLFKPKDPKISVQSVQLQSIYFGGFPQTINTLNVTLVLTVWVHNPNRATFYFSDNVAYLYFYGGQVGFTRVPAGNVGAKSSKDLSLSLTVQAPNLIGGPFLKADVDSGTIPLTASVQVSGHVSTLNIFSHDGLATSRCNVSISLVTHNIIDYTCIYKNSA